MKRKISLFLAFLLALIFLNSRLVTANALSVSAKSAIVINASTGSILYEKNIYEKLPMASTTKIMTALILAEQKNLDTLVTATEEMVTVEGSSMGLLEGDTVSYRDLLYGMLLPSGNDAANTAAIALAGSTEAFADLMNKKAKDLGLNSTNFVTPSGLDAENHYTTAYDLSMLAMHALKNENFKAAASSENTTLFYGNPPYKRTLENHNKLLKSYEGAIGVKTGFTKKSGRCLVSAAERNGATIIAVTLNDPNDWGDHTAMLDYGFSTVEPFNLSSLFRGEHIDVVGSNTKYCDIISDDCFVALSEAEYKNITYKLNIPQFIYAPVAENSEIGSIDYYLNDKLISSAPLKTASSLSSYRLPQKSFTQKVFNTVIYLIKDL